MRPRWWYGALEFDRPLALPLALAPRLRALPATGGLYPKNLACSKAADEVIGGALFADEFVIALPLAAATELVAGNLKQQNSAMTLKLLFPNVRPSESDDDPALLLRYFSGNLQY